MSVEFLKGAVIPVYANGIAVVDAYARAADKAARMAKEIFNPNLDISVQQTPVVPMQVWTAEDLAIPAEFKGARRLAVIWQRCFHTQGPRIPYEEVQSWVEDLYGALTDPQERQEAREAFGAHGVTLPS